MKGDGGSVYLPREAELTHVEALTAKEKLFRIAFPDGEPLGHQPGQFVEVFVKGVGEAPISVSSSPTVKDHFELIVRAVGNVTNALHGMQAGDRVGIRGPYGRGFEVGMLKGKDVLIIGGGIGIVPLRSLINYILDRRSDFGRLVILYGCKEPSELLLRDEVKQWEKREDVELLLTVDRCPSESTWQGNVGLITTLIPQVDVDALETYAVVVGPPVMYKFVIKSLKEQGFPDENILLSLERKMKCGVGKCGHCQINQYYVCMDGPVFNYIDIYDVKEAV